MRDILAFTAPEILAIPITSPEQLYTGDLDAAKGEWHRLQTKWHPDRHAGNGSVMTHVNALYKLALTKLKLGIWVTDGVVRIDTKDGKTYEIKYRRKHDFELGEVYIGDRTVVFAVAEDGYDLVDDGVARIKGFKYASDRMRDEVSRYLPVIFAENETVDRRIIVIKKTPDLLLLRDVMDHLKGAAPKSSSSKDGRERYVKHVAWVLSSLYNLACYLKFAGISHNDISPDTYLISPERHSGALFGGWWYACRVGERLKAVPSRTLLYAPMDLTKRKRGDPMIDLELIRVTGRELLGDITGGGRLSADASIPRPLLVWLQGTSTADALEEYRAWGRVLTDSFGERRFTELKLTADEVYA